jgi:hypothetical protein
MKRGVFVMCICLPMSMSVSGAGGPVPICYQETPSNSCASSPGGMGVHCGNYMCRHFDMYSEQITICTSAPSGFGGCDFTTAHLCEYQFAECGGPTGCLKTGIWHSVYYWSYQGINPECG